MKRSEINTAIKNMENLIKEHGFEIPPFCKWTARDWEEKGHEYDEIRDNMLGWDITDYGLGKFDEVGFALITIRNGNVKNKKYTKTYAEKLLMVNDGQMAPMHFHWNKMEDIINRAGGTLVIQLWKADKEENKTEEPFTVQIDGVTHHLNAGEKVRLQPGESITLEPYIYHCFWAEGEPCMIGEVSKVNDDSNDNRFYAPLGRYPEIIEDEPKAYLLCNEYPKN